MIKHPLVWELVLAMILRAIVLLAPRIPAVAGAAILQATELVFPALSLVPLPLALAPTGSTITARPIAVRDA